MKMKTSWYAITLLAAFGSMAIAARLGSSAQAPMFVQASSAPDPTLSHHAAPGVVEPVGEEREIGSQVIGIIREMRIEENDEVHKGQIIAVVDNADQVARL